ncbi:MAG: restriction endonuclease subunit S [Dorea sp.]|nr:restriction endonuclease subunit S [Dorea sp.]
MSKMISVASGFQYSVNIGYDLNSDDKLKNFIPTKSALMLLEDILVSTNPASNDRARVLIGAYGKGKSHIVLTILSMLMKKDKDLFVNLLPKIEENPRLKQVVENYYESNKKILPVVITGSNTSLPQAFLIALQRTLSENNMMDVMPETNYKAAIQTIKRWKEDYPEVYQKFQNSIDTPVKVFIDKLEEFDTVAYERFEKVYPELTAGSVFNPFLGFDVVELYEAAVKGIKAKGYTGIYVVYDEFSKFLEANISEASVSDTKMLQDFAEKCNRSGESQLHLMLISHKEIANYIDKLPKQKVDGWRGVSERFKHVHLNNNFTQTYEIITSAIQKKSASWGAFCKKFGKSFDAIEQLYAKHNIFSDVNENDIRTMLFGCYPLHPVSTFILPRLSERIAQNERTLFTFISAPGVSTLPSFLELYDDDHFEVITPDLIYDYFEPLFKKEVYTGEIHNTYYLTSVILDKLDSASLECKIVKTLSLIYMLEQFERLQPTKAELTGVFANSYSVEEIDNAIANLIEKEYVIYLKRSNDYLKLKQTSGVDIRQKIADMMEVQSSRITIKETLNGANFDNYIFPSKYNNDREMIRYFSFEFIDEDEVEENIDWNIKSEGIEADGVVYGIIVHNNESILRIQDIISKTSTACDRFVFIIPKNYKEIESVVREFNAVRTLRDSALEDKILFDEYEVIYEDLRDVISEFMSIYTHPELYGVRYYYNGSEVTVSRKAALTGLLSNICEKVYSDTPIINNEAMNRNEITSTANNSRSKIIAALLRNDLEPNLGLSGSGQEVSIMRSTLVRTGIWKEDKDNPSICLEPDDSYIRGMLGTIEQFIIDAGKVERVSFGELYDRLISPEYHIGLRKGLIPIYLAAVMHKYKREIVIADQYGQVALSADTLVQINAKPEVFYLSYLDWDTEKDTYINELTNIFREYVIEEEKKINSYDYVISAMKRWYMALPRYSKECKVDVCGNKINSKFTAVTKALKQNYGNHELLFKRIPEALKIPISDKLISVISLFKQTYDNLIVVLEKRLIEETKTMFAIDKNQIMLNRVSLTSVIKDWCETLEPTVFDELFSDGTDKCLALFRTVTNDEVDFVKKLAQLGTDLRIEDWDDNTINRFLDSIKKWKDTAGAHHGAIDQADDNPSQQEANTYELTFVDDMGNAMKKRFKKVDSTKRGQLLRNQISSAVDAMGQSISDQEKRQILMEILKGMCYR